MSLTGVWQMSHRIGGSHDPVTLVILMSPHDGTFAGTMTTSRTSFQMQGYIGGKEIHWTVGELQYQGTIADARRRIKAGKVRGAGKLLGSFSACRVPSPAGKVEATVAVGHLLACLWSGPSTASHRPLQFTSDAGATHSSAICNVILNVEFGEVMSDVLDRNGLSSEVLQVWRNNENLALEAPGRAQQPLPLSIRDGLIRKMEDVLKVMKADGALEKWYSATALFDMYCGSFADDRLITELPLTCMAVLRWVRSVDCAASSTSLSECVHASEIAHWLHGKGLVMEAQTVSLQQIHDHEKSIFSRLQGICLIPTAYDWLCALFARLDILTQRQHAMSLNHAWDRCVHFVRLCTMKLRSNDPRFPASRIACGLLGHSLVAVRLLHASALQPPGSTAARWAMLFAASQPDGPGAALPCMLPLDRSTVLLQHLVTSCDTDLATLKQDSLHVARFMRDCLHELRIARQSCCSIS